MQTTIKKPQDNNIIFGDIIEYNERFLDIIYITNNNLIDTKLYDTNKFNIAVAKKKATTSTPNTLTKREFEHYPSSIRKILFMKESGGGIVIGQKVKKEGYYSRGCYPSGYGDNYEDYEQASLDVTDTYTFWVVATDMNRTVLIPKK